jgi:hypothetical protein
VLLPFVSRDVYLWGTGPENSRQCIPSFVFIKVLLLDVPLETSNGYGCRATRPASSVIGVVEPTWLLALERRLVPIAIQNPRAISRVTGIANRTVRF